MESFFSLALWIHIAGGFTALLSGLIPMLTKKGGKLHRQGGQIYVAGMSVVFVTAILLSVLKSNAFLFCIGLFSYYMTVTGFRLVRRKNKPAVVFDYAITGIASLTSLLMIGYGSMQWLAGQLVTGPVLVAFGGILLTFSIADWKRITASQLKKMQWYYNHIGRMGGSYIATFTAFAVVNITFLPPLVVWLLPPLIGSIIISYTIRSRQKKNQVMA